MNKSILQRCALLIVMLMATMAASADRIYFNPDVIKVEDNSEDGIEIAIALENSQPIYGFQLSLHPNWQCTFADCWLSSRADDSYQLVTSDKNTAGLFTIGAFSTNNTPLAGKDGDLLHIKLKTNGAFYRSKSIVITSALLVTTGDEEFAPTIGSSLQIQTVTPISWIGVDPEEISIPVGMTHSYQLSYYYQPSNATATAVTWSSSDPSVATVTDGGYVSGIAPGEAIVTVTAESGVTAECRVTVYPIEIDWIGVNPEEISIPVGMTPPYKLSYYYQPSDATATEVTWSSSDTDVATVTEEGYVLGIAPGEAIITVTAESGVTAECRVTVLPIEVSNVTLNRNSAELKANETLQLTATVSPENATDKTVTWASSNNAVATVDATGKVTAIAVGEATITATSGSAWAECQISVVATPVESVTLNRTTAELKARETLQLTATVEPEDATDKTVSWASSNNAVATVDATGKVTAIAVGEATITATSGSARAECRISVVATTVASLTLNRTTAELKANETLQLTATVWPEDATDKTVSWASSNNAVATVDATGKVTAIAVGKATITATSGSARAECRISVVATPVASVTLNRTTAELKANETLQLTATVSPENATDKTVSWASSNNAVATVDATGKVTAIAVGEATITATAGSVRAECRISVVATPVESLTLNRTTAELKANETLQLTATVSPEDATDKTVSWASSNNAVATVDATGKVTAIAVGEATITATSGSVRAECRISVVATPVETAYINNGNSTLTVGTSMELTVTILPIDASDKSVVWSSSDAAVARVDENGLVEALSVGEANISALFSNGETSTITVTVIAPPAESIELSETSFEGDVDATLQLSATIYPAEAAEQELAWASSDTAVATVDNTGLVTIVGYGDAEISVSTTDGSNLIAICIVKGLPLSGIDAVFADERVRADVYTVGGLLVKTCATKADFKRLSPGVYIVNGKKVVNF